MTTPQPENKRKSRTIRLSIPRRIMCDLLAFSRGIPTVPVQRRMNLEPAVEARARLESAPGWCAIFTKAYAIAAVRFPELRRVYLPFPWAHIYEHSSSTASIAVERQYQGENAVFWGQLPQPDREPLEALHAQLRRFKEDPIESFDSYRRMLRVGRLPTFLRRMIWWVGLNVSGRKRAGYLGTYGVSVYSGLGAESLHPLSPLTTTLNYGTIEKDGSVPVRIVYDHRTLDGATIARVLVALEDIINREIVAELNATAISRAA